MGGKSAPSIDPRLGEAAVASAQLGKDALAWYQQVYDRDLKPQQDRQMDLNDRLISGYLSDQALQRQFATEQNEYYKQTFRPVEEQSVRDAMEYDSAANINKRMGIASAATKQAFSDAQASSNRNLMRYGLNPNSGAFAATNARMANQQALADAGARTGTAVDTMDKGIALRAGMANFGRNMPNTAAQYFGLANQTGGLASNTAAAGMDAARANAAMVGQGYNQAMQGYGQAGNLWGQDFNARMQTYNANGQGMAMLGNLAGMAIGGFAGGAGSAYGKSLFGGKADGGHIGPGPVVGPGGPIDDMIDAKLSNGEYVIPADTVKTVGVKNLDKLVKSTHTPAEQQRKGLRRVRK